MPTTTTEAPIVGLIFPTNPEIGQEFTEEGRV
jgi:hypothetical protein